MIEEGAVTDGREPDRRQRGMDGSLAHTNQTVLIKGYKESAKDVMELNGLLCCHALFGFCHQLILDPYEACSFYMIMVWRVQFYGQT